MIVDNLNATISSRSTLAQADILSDATPFAGANVDATISSRSTLAQADILSDATPFAGANVDAAISSRSTLAQADILSDATPFAGGNVDATISSRSSHSAADVWTVVARTITGGTITTNGDKTGYALTAAADIAIADAILERDIDNVEASMALHSLGTAVLKAVSRIRDNAGTYEVYRTNGATLHMSQGVTVDATLDPIDELGVGV